MNVSAFDGNNVAAETLNWRSANVEKAKIEHKTRITFSDKNVSEIK